jgi:glycosyltransferase involved in cell wall biosynthesis
MGSLDLLRVLQMSGSTPAAISRRSHGVPYAVTYGYDAMGLARSGGGKRAALARWSLFLATRSAEVIFCATESLVGQMERRRPRGRVVLLPNGVDLRRFRARPVRASAQGRWKVFSVGRLAAEKNYAMLVAAAAGLGDVELHLVGDGPEAASLDRAAERAQVPLTRHGVVPQEKLALLLSEADLFVLPSRSEGHPKALIEAMACALPCIGTNVPGLRDVLENGVNGLLVAETALELKGTIRRLLMDRELALRLGEAARRTVERNFDLDRILKSEVAILEGLALDARRRGRIPVTVT